MFVELCGGLGAMSLALQHGKHCKPPVSRMGSKSGYSLALLRVMGLRPGQGAESYLWCEPDPGCRALLHAYTDPALMREAADIIRGWKDEDPRALWERLRAEGPIKGFDARSVAAWTLDEGWGGIAQPPTFNGPGCHPSHDGSRTAETMGARLDSLAEASELARYLQVTASNRLVNIDSTTMQNSGKGGTTFGGSEFATPAETVSEAAREVARFSWLAPRSRKADPKHGFQVAQSDSPAHTGGPNYGAETPADRMNPVGLPATIVPDARDIHPPPLPDGCVVYADFPYLGDGTQKITGYGHDLTLEDQCDLVRRWDAAGAAVYVSECVDRREDFGGAFKWAVDITRTRVGQKRSFSTDLGKTEWVTMNRPPAWVPAIQQSLFG
jgi:hypothetical protein